MEGKITITDKRGGIILTANIWVVLFMPDFNRMWTLGPGDIRVYIDGQEVDIPEVLTIDT